MPPSFYLTDGQVSSKAIKVVCGESSPLLSQRQRSYPLSIAGLEMPQTGKWTDVTVIDKVKSFNRLAVSPMTFANRK
jgi:hypothetical protein